MDTSQKLTELKELIKVELDLCDRYSTPTVCKMRNESYAQLEKLIIEKVVVEKRTISSAIIAIEYEFNINKQND